MPNGPLELTYTVRDVKMAHTDLPSMGFPGKLGPARKRLAFSQRIAESCRPSLCDAISIAQFDNNSARADERL
jgi:hypothetical protein